MRKCNAPVALAIVSKLDQRRFLRLIVALITVAAF
jgi:hypothetical protein